MSPRPVLAALARVAMEATGAAGGRLVTPAAEVVVGSPPADSGLAAYVLASGQPQVLTHGAESSALCAPCISDGEVVGTVELADKAGGGAFSIDDLEMACLLGGIAGVAITAEPPPAPAAGDPVRLAGDLERLAATDPARYETVARLLRGLVGA